MQIVENRIWHFMQIVSDNLHEISKPVFWKNKKNLSIRHLQEILPRVLSVLVKPGSWGEPCMASPDRWENYCPCIFCTFSNEENKPMSRNVRKCTFLQVRSPKTQISLKHLHSLIRVFFVRMKELCIIGYQKCAQWRFLSDCAKESSLGAKSEGTFTDIQAFTFFLIFIDNFIFDLISPLTILSLMWCLDIPWLFLIAAVNYYSKYLENRERKSDFFNDVRQNAEHFTVPACQTESRFKYDYLFIYFAKRKPTYLS